MCSSSRLAIILPALWTRLVMKAFRSALSRRANSYAPQAFASFFPYEVMSDENLLSTTKMTIEESCGSEANLSNSSAEASAAFLNSGRKLRTTTTLFSENMEYALACAIISAAVTCSPSRCIRSMSRAASST